MRTLTCSPLRLAGCLLAGCLLASCAQNAEESSSTTAHAAGAPRSGAKLYDAYCTVCHGVDGDGKGIAQLDRPARSFKDGGFSFGNTVEALRRTIANGIAGTPMPGFGAALKDAELTRLAEHVRALGPETVPAAGDAAILKVTDRPRFARGQLEPITKGAPFVPRGLLVGTLDGLSWQYRIDDVRLLGVRQGRFIERSDWTGRGGAPLTPLGRLIDTIDSGAGKAPFRKMNGEPLPGQLMSTRIQNARAVLRYSLAAGPDSQPLAIVDESGRAAKQRSQVPGYERSWSIEAANDDASRAHRPALEYALPQTTDPIAIPARDGTRWRRSKVGAPIRAFGLQIVDEAGRALPFEVRSTESETLVAIPESDRTISFSVVTLMPADDSEATWSKLREELAR